ncbi:MAG: c-type cytochrome [Myxococcales bacterium]|nr:c-type cytochrome [Myxococcales bacterium]
MAPQDAIASGDQAGLVEQGRKLFAAKACNTCHSIDGSRRIGPSMKGLWGSVLKLPNGRSLSRNESYMRQQILDPNSVISPNYPPVMPSYKTQISADQLKALLAYLASLGGANQAKAPSSRPLAKTSQPKHPNTPPAPSQKSAAPAAKEQMQTALKAWKEKEIQSIGRRYYLLNCSFCHGARGKGDGPGGRTSPYKIRDFSKGEFLYGRSPDILFQIISNGSPRTSVMPPWKHLPKVARWALVRYLLSL